MNHGYDDMLSMPHHVSVKHPHMPIRTRAGQFAPFAALTGYDAVIQETARLTERRVELDECAKADLNARLCLLLDALPQHPAVSITYFVPDDQKDGGAYRTAAGVVYKLDLDQKYVVIGEGRKIPIEHILKLQGDLFSKLEWDSTGW